LRACSCRTARWVSARPRSLQIVASTYEPLPSYRLVTPNGVLILPDGLDKHVLAYLEKVDAEERGE
jgi:hypothetical protein